MSKQSTPPEFLEALYSLRECDFGPHVEVSEIVAPSGIAPYSAAIRFDCPPATADQTTGGSGRLVVLYDPAGQEGWDGTFRLVAMIHAHVDPDLTQEDMIEQVAWSWLHDCLNASGAGYSNTAGSVTRVISTGFGGLKLRDQQAEMEIRASWTPNTSELTPHAKALANLLSVLAGYPVDLGFGLVNPGAGAIQLI